MARLSLRFARAGYSNGRSCPDAGSVSSRLQLSMVRQWPVMAW
ncbi:hypothetical protein COLO4_35879 [Corchorus olitorius]|uniref:Uncharacterized protein n=1 Tax=Corchorus olitorius TaxID=93759 RepID=A0A1R3GCC2_9ROSI|nr:hypothetical protein COLO4_35879 [Corchorus olitorius]